MVLVLLMEYLLTKLRVAKIKKFIPKDSIACDIGCGRSGYFLKAISPFIIKGIGFDKKVLSSDSKKIELRNLGIERDIPLPDESVNCVTMLAVLEHLNYPQNILCECFRMLKPGGILILTTPSPASKPLLEFLAFKIRLISKEEIGDHKTYFSKEALMNLFKASGFNRKDVVIRSFQLGFNTFAFARKESVKDTIMQLSRNQRL